MIISHKIYARSLRERAKIFIVFILIAALLPLWQFICVSQSGALTPSRRNFLLTSYNSEYYSLFQISGNTIYARGKYADDRIKKIFIAGLQDETGSYKMKAESDGSYEAEITCEPPYDSSMLVVQLSSGAAFGYRIEYSGGWYFPDNGLSAVSKSVFDNIIDASPESTGYYISKTADAEEIATVQEQIKLISDSVTEGITDDYDKARALALYVAEHFYYDHDARVKSVTETNVVLYDVLKTSRTVCTGFADLYCALLQAQGIDAVNIKGGSTGGEVEYENLTDGVQNHEYTAFYHKTEERWVWVDSCWNGSGDYENGEYKDDKAHEKYFDISDEALALDHRADYAERRSFFSAKAAEPKEEETTEPETTSSPAETAPPEETTAVSETAEEQISPEAEKPDVQEQDNTVLYIIIGILAVLVIGAGVAVIVIFKGNKSEKD